MCETYLVLTKENVHLNWNEFLQPRVRIGAIHKVRTLG